MKVRGAIIATLLAGMLGMTASCGSGDGPPAQVSSVEGNAAIGDPQSPDLPPLPALDAMAAPVQRQIRSQRETLDRMLRQGGASDGELSRELGTMGQLLMAAESPSAAEPYLTRAARLEPAEPRWPYYLGHLHRMLGDTASAARYFEQTLSLRHDDVPALVWLGNVHLDRGEPDRAIPLYERALARQPGLFAALFGLGRAALVAGSNAQAAEHLEAALAAAPEASAVHYPLALAYRQLGRFTDAEEHMRRRGESAPGPPDPLMQEVAGILQSPVVFERRGDQALARGDAATAVATFREGLALAPDRTALKQKLATSLALAGDVPAALALYQEILEKDPEFAEAHYSLGALLLGSGRLDLAVERFAAAVSADPTYLQARLQLAHTLRQAGRLDEALVAYQGALSVDPRLAEARLGYAMALAGLGRWGTARAWLLEGRRAHPERLEFSERLVRVLAASPDPNVRDGDRALQLARELGKRSRSWRTLEALAMALAETGAYAEAAARQREAIEARRREGSEPEAAMLDELRRYESGQPSRVPWRAG